MTHLKNGSQLQKWVPENVLQLQKWVTLKKCVTFRNLGHSWKNALELEKLVTGKYPRVRKMCHCLKKWGRVRQMGKIKKIVPHLKKWVTVKKVCHS